MPIRSLFVSYDGVLAGPGRTQTIPYVTGLAGRGHAMGLLSFEAPELLDDSERVSAAARELDGITWSTLPRRGRQMRDLAAGLAALRTAGNAHGAELVHARGYVPAFLADRLGVPFLFDMRGFWPDERVDGGLWKKRSFGYRLWKGIERRLLRRAAGVIVLTERARDEIRRLEMAPADTRIDVIPTCADLDRFTERPPAERPEAARGERPRYLILGGTSTWYLREEMLDLAARALQRDADAVLHVLTQDDHEPIVAGLAARGVEAARALVTSVSPADVPRWISGARAAISLIRSTWSKGASCPTKMGELLGCGVPILMNAGIGDADRVLQGDAVGVTVTGFASTDLDAALTALDRLYADGEAALRLRCRSVAEREYALPIALDRYEAAYAAAAEAAR